jgi:uncharacterized membrane protein
MSLKSLLISVAVATIFASSAAPALAHKAHQQGQDTAPPLAPAPEPAVEPAPEPAVEPAAAPAADASASAEPGPAAEPASAAPPAVSSPAPAPALALAPAPEEVRVTPAAITEQAFTHLHNKLVHLPIGFGLALLLLQVLGARAPWFPPAARNLALATAAAAVVAVLAGLRQGDEFGEDVPELATVLQLHKIGGLATGALAIALGLVWVSESEKLARFRAPLAWVLGAALIGAGLFGGWLSTSG